MSKHIRQAVVLAGGAGTRLGSLTETTPKPLLRVGGRPFLEWLIGNLDRNGVTDVVLTIGYRADAFGRWLEQQPPRPRLTTRSEAEPLGTGGALTKLRDTLDDAFFVLNGDTLFDVPLQDLSATLLDADAQAAVALREVGDVSRYGAVSLDGSAISGFEEKGGVGPGLINGGVYALRWEAVADRVPPFSLEADVFPELVREGKAVGLPSDGFFIDIGVPDSFEEAQLSVPAWWEGARAG